MTTKLNPKSPLQGFVCSLGYTEKIEVQHQILIGLAASAVAIVILVSVNWFDRDVALFWALGLAFGFVLQRLGRADS